jgi:glycosyltransferase involved in cell wall biosynthesis
MTEYTEYKESLMDTPMTREHSLLELTILMPYLNEAETIATCVKKASDYLSRSRIRGEVLIADKGSSDGSPQIAQRLGAPGHIDF